MSRRLYNNVIVESTSSRIFLFGTGADRGFRTLESTCAPRLTIGYYQNYYETRNEEEKKKNGPEHQSNRLIRPLSSTGLKRFFFFFDRYLSTMHARLFRLVPHYCYAPEKKKEKKNRPLLKYKTAQRVTL